MQLYDATCIRRVSNWSNVSKYHKFDNSEFDVNKMREDMRTFSPKLIELLNNIKALDERDIKESGKLYKHVIFSDVKQAGVKIIASGLIATNQWTLGYDRNVNVYPDNILLKNKGSNFLVLCSTPVYGIDISNRKRVNMLLKYNERPDNINGNMVRIILLDSGYKEGIDLYDVKYMHIFEPQITASDTKQVIGRATRMCGQKGLEFHPNRGWELKVYIYDVMMQDQSLYDLYMKHSGIDLKLYKFIDEIEKYTINGAVDYELTKNIHDFKLHTDTIQNSFSFGGESVACYRACSDKPSREMPITTQIFILVRIILDKSVLKTRQEYCKIMKEDMRYCDELKLAWSDPINYVLKNKEKVINAYNSKLHSELPHDLKMSYVQFINGILNLEGNSRENKVLTKHFSSAEMQKYINHNYLSYKWPRVDIVNECLMNQLNQGIKLTPTQNFIKNYFTPDLPYKGMLLWHSVGTGKTCSAISAATATFEAKGYTILWVTRTTLKDDIWKNMFEQVCSESIKKKIDSGYHIPEDHSLRLKLLSDSWAIRPLSYKQFTNLISEKNAYYNKLVDINGKVDPLKRTLLIIDEAHKLYSPSDLNILERPDTNKLKQTILNSYEVSGANSVKVLLMTATPIMNDAMELIKLLNLCKERHKQMPDTYGSFSSKYLDNEGKFSKEGGKLYMDDITGHVSYLSRTKDVRQFAQPSIIPITTEIGRSKYSILELEKLEAEYEKNAKKNEELLLDLQKSIKDIERIKVERNRFMNDACDDKRCVDLVSKEIHNLEKEYAKEVDELSSKFALIKEQHKKEGDNIRIFKMLMKEDKSQESIINFRCLADNAVYSKNANNANNVNNKINSELQFNGR